MGMEHAKVAFEVANGGTLGRCGMLEQGQAENDYRRTGHGGSPVVGMGTKESLLSDCSLDERQKLMR